MEELLIQLFTAMSGVVAQKRDRGRERHGKFQLPQELFYLLMAVLQPDATEQAYCH